MNEAYGSKDDNGVITHLETMDDFGTNQNGQNGQNNFLQNLEQTEYNMKNMERKSQFSQDEDNKTFWNINYDMESNQMSKNRLILGISIVMGLVIICLIANI